MTSDDDRPILIVGGGPAAHRCIEAYRDGGGDRDVVLVSDDDRLPYYRPALTKEFLRGEQASVELRLADDRWYTERGVTLRIGEAAHSLDPAGRTIGIGREVVSWTACVLATGSEAAPLPVEGADDPGVLSIRRAADAERVIAALGGISRAVVIGSGFIGCEAAASLRARGVEVVMISQEPAPQHGRLGEEVAGFLSTWLEALGVEVVGGAEVRSIGRMGKGWKVTTDARTVDAGLVLVAAGARPRIELAQEAGLGIDHAVLVDPDMRTNSPEVFAVGDIAEAFHPVARRRLRVEHWGDAIEMGAVAGSVLAGRPTEWTAVPGFWSTIGDRTLKQASWGGGWDAVSIQGDADGFTAWYGTDGVVTGVLTHERDDDYERGQELMREAAPFEATLSS